MKNFLINLLNKIKGLGKRRLIFLALIILALVIALPLTIIQVQQQQNLRQRADEVTMFVLASNVSINGDSLQVNLVLKNNTAKDVTGINMEIFYPETLNELISFQPEATVVTIANKNSVQRIQFTGINPTDHALTGDIPIGTLTIDASSLKDASKIKRITEITALSTITYYNPDDTNTFTSSGLISETDLASLINQLPSAPISQDQIKCQGSTTPPPPSRTIGTFSIYGIVCDQNNNPKIGVDITLSGHALNAAKTDSNGSYSFSNLEPSNYALNVEGNQSRIQNLTEDTRIDLMIQSSSENNPASPTSVTIPTATPTNTPTSAPTPTTLTSSPPTPTPTPKAATGTICYYGGQCESGFCDYDPDFQAKGMTYGFCR